jgi:hypothetical protein
VVGDDLSRREGDKQDKETRIETNRNNKKRSERASDRLDFPQRRKKEND